MSTIEERRAEVHRRWEKKTGKSANFSSLTKKDVCTLIWLIDDIFLGGQIKEKLKSTYSTLECKTTHKTSSVAGYCQKRKCHYVMSITVPSFSTLFKKGEKVMVANGLYCNDALGCLQLTTEHEMVHLLMNLWGYYSQTYRTARGKRMRVHPSHGKLFQCMVKELFGHSDFRHELGKEASGRLTKEDVTVGMMIQFTSKDGKVTIGKIDKKNPRRAKIRTGTGVWNVPYGMLRKATDKKGALPPSPKSPLKPGR